MLECWVCSWQGKLTNLSASVHQVRKQLGKSAKKFCYSGYCSPKNWLISHRNMTRERKAWLVIKKERDLSIALNQGCQIKALGPEFHKTFYVFQSLHDFQKTWKRTSILHFLQLYFRIMYVSHISFPPPIKTHHIDLVFSLSTVKKNKKNKKIYSGFTAKTSKQNKKEKKYSSFTGLTHLRLKWAVFGPQCKMSLTAMLTNAFYNSLLTFDFIILYQVLTIICHPHRGIY